MGILVILDWNHLEKNSSIYEWFRGNLVEIQPVLSEEMSSCDSETKVEGHPVSLRSRYFMLLVNILSMIHQSLKELKK